MRICRPGSVSRLNRLAGAEEVDGCGCCGCAFTGEADCRVERAVHDGCSKECVGESMVPALSAGMSLVLKKSTVVLRCAAMDRVGGEKGEERRWSILEIVVVNRLICPHSSLARSPPTDDRLFWAKNLASPSRRCPLSTYAVETASRSTRIRTDSPVWYARRHLCHKFNWL